MFEEHKKTILAALENYRGDNYSRALSYFRHLSKSEMDAQYGNSGKTKQQLLDKYKKHDDEIEDAIVADKSL